VSDVDDSLSLYWQTFPKLKKSLFKPFRKGYYALKVEKDGIRDTIYNDRDFSIYFGKVEAAFENWKAGVDKKLRKIDNSIKPKMMIDDIARQIIERFEPVTLVDKYDAYEVLLSYWNETMSDDVYLLIQDGYKTIREIEVFRKTITKKKKDGTETTKTSETGWDGKLIPKSLIVEMFFAKEKKSIDGAELVVAEKQSQLDELLEIDEESDEYDEDKIKKLQKEIKEKNKLIKELNIALDNKTRDQYKQLTDNQCMELLLERKWYRSLLSDILALYSAVSHRITKRITELADRYEQTLPEIETEVEKLKEKVKSHLKKMGFV
jgi:type I restriction enzyme M protein